MTTTLLIARHGNTFGPGEIPRRVGARTDLSLVDSGQNQARALGRYLKEHNLVPDLILTSQLKRTKEMAEIAKAEIGLPIETHPLAIFNEIDYGPDEDKPEAEVLARLGAEALKQWDDQAIAPPGWNVDTAQIIQNWLNFANGLETGSKTLVITSNGIARFAPHISGGFESDKAHHTLKIATGALCIFEKETADWAVRGWNIKP